MDSADPLAQDMTIFVDEIVQAAPEHPDNPTEEDRRDTERESPSQPVVNFLVDVISSQECSQAPTSGTVLASSQQPSPEFLMSLGVKVRDFAYENTLPPIVPVPRVPRQVQPTPRALKRSQRDWDDKEGMSTSSSSVRLSPRQTGTKKPKSLERKATEPLQEPVVPRTRALERITLKGVCSMFTSPSRSTLPTTTRTRFSASPPTSPLTPPPPDFAAQESRHVQTSSTFPFVVHAESPSIVPSSQLDSETQPLSLHPVLYTRFMLDSCSSPGCSSAPSPPQNASPAPLVSAIIAVPSPAKESRVDLRARKRRGRGTPPPSNRYQLRQRPISSSRASTLSRCSHRATNTPKSPSRRTRRVWLDHETP